MSKKETPREAYYREIYRAPAYAPTFSTDPPHPEQSVLFAAQQHFAQAMHAAARTHRLQPYVVESRARQLAYLHQHYGEDCPAGIGIGQGEYASIATADVNATNRFLATDGLMDCHALVLVARDATGHVAQTLLAHIDAKIAVAKALPELLATLPAGSRIEATVIGSPNSYNYYLQADLIDALAHTPRIDRIRYHFDAAHTVAVDTATGHILTASGPVEPQANVGVIHEWPIDFAFASVGNAAGFNTTLLTEHFFRLARQHPAFTLERAYDTRTGFITADPLATYVLDRQRNDGMLDGNQLREIAGEIGATLKAHVSLGYQVDANGQATIDILGDDGRKISSFISAKLDAALGPHGTIEAPNTPPAPGRATARGTR